MERSAVGMGSPEAGSSRACIVSVVACPRLFFDKSSVPQRAQSPSRATRAPLLYRRLYGQRIQSPTQNLLVGTSLQLSFRGHDTRSVSAALPSGGKNSAAWGATDRPPTRPPASSHLYRLGSTAGARRRASYTIRTLRTQCTPQRITPATYTVYAHTRIRGPALL